MLENAGQQASLALPRTSTSGVTRHFNCASRNLHATFTRRFIAATPRLGAAGRSCATDRGRAELKRDTLRGNVRQFIVHSSTSCA